MARVSIYLSFPGQTGEAFNFYQSVFAGGKAEQAPQDIFWGAYFGSYRDKFGVQWMFNCSGK